MKRRLNTEGSIYQRKSDLRWCVSISTKEGRPVRYASTQEEALEILKNWRKELKEDVAPSELFVSFASRWFKQSFQQKRIREVTARYYHHRLERHIIPSLGNVPVSEITPAMISKMYSELADEGVSQHILNLVHRILSSCLSTAVPHILQYNPCSTVKMKKAPSKKKKIFTSDEADKFIAHIKKSRSRIVDLIMILWETGCRSSEIIGLKWQYVFADHIKIEETRTAIGNKAYDSEPKTASSRRTIYLSKESMEIINRQPKTSEYVFTTETNKPHNYACVRKQWGKFMEQVFGKEDAFTLHSLRHLQATNLIQAGWSIADIQARGGWSNAKVLTDIYTAHTSEERQRKIAESAKLLHKTTTEEKQEAENHGK